MATTRKPRQSKAKVEVEVDEDEELEELEDELDDLDELEALADEDEDEDAEEEDDEDDDEDEAPRRKKTSKTKTAAKTKKKREPTIYGTSALADDLETDGKNLRVMLRDIGANKPRKKGTKGSFNEAGRYEWDDLEDALETLGFEDVDEAIEALTEARNTRLDALKERNATKKKATAKKKVKPVVDEADEDEDEDEDEEPAPKKRTTRSTRSRK